MTLDEALWQDDGRVSGSVCFRDTRVPMAILFDYLQNGSLEEFLDGYPGVAPEQAHAVIQAARRMVQDAFPGRRLWNEDE